VPGSSFPRDVAAAGPATAWVVDEAGRIAVTTDGGVTWTERSHPAAVPIRHVVATEVGVVWAAGPGGAILRGTPG
jgi:photosystem II stability/assembly factor-like uncharacterized protein